MGMPTMHKHHLTASAALVAFLALSACGTSPGPGAGDGGTVRPDLPVAGVRWSVESVTVDGRKTAAPADAHLSINSKGRAGGNLGCNHFGADTTVEGDTITFGRAVTTEMACEKPVQSFENALKAALTGKVRAELADGTLTLTTADGDSVRLTERPDAPLVGTKWTVESLISDRTASSLPAAAQGKAYVVFGKDGSARGNLGCNSFSAKATAEGTAITFGPVASTRKLCPGPGMDVERALLKAMKGKTTYKITDGSLTLTGADGAGFAATASDEGKAPGAGTETDK